MCIIDGMKRLMRIEAFSYLFFGVLTTVVNYTIFVCGLALAGQDDALLVNLVAFAGATLFAFITNKIFVFQSSSWSVKQSFSELCKFVAARVFSLCIEQIGLYLSIELFHVENYDLCSVNGLVIVKIILSFVSVLLNYFASKFVVFKKEKR